eukprot:1190397-Prorocentrum_minimum.AAC.1
MRYHPQAEPVGEQASRGLGVVCGDGRLPEHTLRPLEAGPPSCPARGLVPCRPPLPGDDEDEGRRDPQRGGRHPHKCEGSRHRLPPWQDERYRSVERKSRKRNRSSARGALRGLL